jgi:hypothetical protein
VNWPVSRWIGVELDRKVDWFNVQYCLVTGEVWRGSLGLSFETYSMSISFNIHPIPFPCKKRLIGLNHIVTSIWWRRCWYLARPSYVNWRPVSIGSYFEEIDGSTMQYC